MSTVKAHKRKIAHVKVSYDSGSDGDIESEEDEDMRKSPAKKFSVHIQKSRTKQKTSKDGEGDEDDVAGEEEEEDVSDDDRSENEGNEEEGDGDGSLKSGGGWADAMASILRKEAPEGGSAVLSKSKDFARAKEEEKKEFMERLKERQSKKKWENLAKVIPKVIEKDYERNLQRIATKGVVQLFNAVRKQQKTREEKMKEVGGSQRKRAKVEASLTKGVFLDLLKGTPAPSKSQFGSKVDKASEKKPSPAEQPSWGVLREDFMLGAEMKDWDKAQDSDESDDEEDSGLSSDSD